MPWLQLWRIFSEYRTEEARGKKWYRSKTLISLIVATATLIANQRLGRYGIQIPPEVQVTIVLLIGVAMRFISKGSIGFYEDAKAGDISEVADPSEDEQPVIDFHQETAVGRQENLTVYQPARDVESSEPTAAVQPQAPEELPPERTKKPKKFEPFETDHMADP
jgi:hypothetical protein